MKQSKNNEEKTNVMRVLESKKIAYLSHSYEPDQTLTGEDIAGILGEDASNVFKTLVTQGKTGQYYVFVVPVNAELDLKKAAKAAGVSKEIRVSPHTCRHTFAHINLKNGIDLYTLSRLLGHENVSITQRYLEGITDEGVIRIARRTGVLENIR